MWGAGMAGMVTIFVGVVMVYLVGLIATLVFCYVADIELHKEGDSGNKHKLRVWFSLLWFISVPYLLYIMASQIDEDNWDDWPQG